MVLMGIRFHGNLVSWAVLEFYIWTFCYSDVSIMSGEKISSIGWCQDSAMAQSYRVLTLG